MSYSAEQIDTLARDWFRRCRESQMAHFEYGSRLEAYHTFLGVPSVALSTIAGTAAAGSIAGTEEAFLLEVATVILSMSAATLTSLQTFLNLPDRVAKHRAAGAAYSALRRELEIFKMLPPESGSTREFFEGIRKRMDELSANAPGIPSSFKAQVDKKLQSEMYPRIFSFPASPPATTG